MKLFVFFFGSIISLRTLVGRNCEERKGDQLELTSEIFVIYPNLESTVGFFFFFLEWVGISVVRSVGTDEMLSENPSYEEGRRFYVL